MSTVMKLYGSDNRGGIAVKTYTKSICSHNGFFFNAGPSSGESEVKTEIACSLSQLGLLCSTYILF